MKLSPSLNSFLKNIFSEKQLKVLRDLYSQFHQKDLRQLATIYHSDKWNCHFYAQYYNYHFSALRHRSLNILEIGIGGDNDPRRGGASLRMWKTYFPKSMIYGIDLYDKKFHEEKRIKTFQGSQNDLAFLKQVVTEIGSIDIIIGA